MILVAGATGNAGGAVVRELVDAGEPTRALVRPGTAPAGLDDSVELAEADLNRAESISRHVGGVRAAFLLSGYKELDRTLAAMRDAGVERVVLLSSSAAPDGSLDNAIARYHILSEQSLRDSGIAWVFLRPNAFMSNTLRWLPQLRQGDVVKLPFADVAISMIHPDDLGAVAARALTAPDLEGRGLRLSGPRALRPAEQVEILAETIGRSLRFEAQPNEQARAEMLANMPAEYVDAFFDFYVEGSIDETTVHSTVADVLGREPRPFEDWARENADKFR